MHEDCSQLVEISLPLRQNLDLCPRGPLLLYSSPFQACAQVKPCRFRGVVSALGFAINVGWVALPLPFCPPTPICCTSLLGKLPRHLRSITSGRRPDRPRFLTFPPRSNMDVGADRVSDLASVLRRLNSFHYLRHGTLIFAFGSPLFLRRSSDLVQP